MLEIELIGTILFKIEIINQIVESFKQVALQNKAVWTFKYQDSILINAQPNNKNYSVIIETDPLMSFNSNTGTITLNMDVLSFVDSTECEIQDIAAQIGLSILHKVVDANRRIMSLSNYSILFFTKKTDNVCAGCRFTIQLSIPEFIDYCTLEDSYLTEEEYEQKLESMKDKELNLGDANTNTELDLKPLKL